VSQCIPLDLKGKRVLDIGAFDGYYSFLCEQRGADVVAIDIDPEHLRSFDIAKEVLSSNVEYRILSVYDLEQLEGLFDYVLFFGVIYHLRNPIWALEKIKAKLDGVLFIESAYIKTLASSARFSWAKSGDPRTYWRPSVKCLERMCKLVGFEDVKILAKRWQFPWRRGRILLRAVTSMHACCASVCKDNEGLHPDSP